MCSFLWFKEKSLFLAGKIKKQNGIVFLISCKIRVKKLLRNLPVVQASLEKEFN